ncbi:transaldolase family protein [Paraclostridium bifermentans]|uniref:transaldolase family protein n=1 Tax=Paraclostridium bifermentans TaxID=1490 RepID=UPI00359CA0EB
MKLIIDTANINIIKEMCKYYPIDGVTTNPSILAKENKNPYEVLKEIREFLGNDLELHVQVISSKSEDMIKEAHKILKELGDNTYIKIPANKEGIKAMKDLVKDKINITATTVYTPMQAYLAGKAGAKYVAPYVNRIDNLGANGVNTTKDINDILINNNMDTEVLAASFKNSQQVLELTKYGIGAATLAPSVLEGLINLDSVNCALDKFIYEFEETFGKEKTMKNI